MRYNKQHILIALLYFTFYTLLKNYIYYCCLYRSNRSPMAFTANAHAFFAYDLKIGSNCFLFLVDSSSSIFARISFRGRACGRARCRRHFWGMMLVSNVLNYGYRTRIWGGGSMRLTVRPVAARKWFLLRRMWKFSRCEFRSLVAVSRLWKVPRERRQLRTIDAASNWRFPVHFRSQGIQEVFARCRAVRR